MADPNASGVSTGSAPDTNSGSGNANSPWLSLIGPAFSAIGSNSSIGGVNKAIDTQGAAYGSVAGTYGPQYGMGVGADASLSSALGLNGAPPNYAAFEKTPGFQFGLQLGDQGINRAAAATGGGFSTSTLAELSKFNTGYAQQAAFQPYIQNLLAAAGLGNSANAGIAGARLGTANNISTGQAAAGNAGATQMGQYGNLLSKVPWGQVGSWLNSSGSPDTSPGYSLSDYGASDPNSPGFLNAANNPSVYDTANQGMPDYSGGGPG